MKRFGFVLALLAVACDGEARRDPGSDDAAAFPTAFAEALPVCTADIGAQPQVEVVATGLEVPWDLAFLPDGRILVTERAGRIRVIRDGQLLADPWATIPALNQAEAGLMGIDIAPDFETSRHVFVAVATQADLGGPIAGIVRRAERALTEEGGYPITTGVLRLHDADGVGVDPVAVIDGIPAGQLHVGGALRFGPDGKLWLGTGDAAEPSLAISMKTRAASILRYNSDGTTPEDGPFAGSPVFARGFRNVQALDWNEGALFATDHGPTGLLAEDRRTGHDEINRVEAGIAYGWPAEAGRVEAPRYRPPIIQWTEAIAPAGMAFWRGEPAWQGDLFVSGLAGRDLFRIHFDADSLAPLTPNCIEAVLDGRFGRIRAVRMGPDGWIYLTTSNRDGRGVAGPDDDRVLRVRPAASDAAEGAAQRPQ